MTHSKSHIDRLHTTLELAYGSQLVFFQWTVSGRFLQAAQFLRSAAEGARVAGFHCSCGKWLGNDDSADPFFEVAMNDRPDYLLPVEREAWAGLFEPFFWEPLGEETQARFPPAVVRLLAPPARQYRAAMAKVVRRQKGA